MTSRVTTFGSDFLSRLRNLTFLTWSVGWCSFPCQKLLLVLYSFNSNPPVVRLNIILFDASCVPTPGFRQPNIKMMLMMIMMRQKEKHCTLKCGLVGWSQVC